MRKNCVCASSMEKLLIYPSESFQTDKIVQFNFFVVFVFMVGVRIKNKDNLIKRKNVLLTIKTMCFILFGDNKTKMKK